MCMLQNAAALSNIAYSCERAKLNNAYSCERAKLNNAYSCERAKLNQRLYMANTME